MTVEIALVLGIALVAILLFATEKLRIDAVALLVLSALAILGLVSPGEALGGFSNQATITVAAMFILAAGLDNSGALSGIGRLLGQARSPLTFLLVLFGVLAAIAPFVNNTAVVAVFMPLVMTAAAGIGMSASKALIPLSYVSQMAGVCTLVGTSTNLLVNAMARDLGHPGFSMFEFTPLGVICFVVGCIYLLTLGRWLLPDARATELAEQYELGKYITELRVLPDSSLIGVSVGEAKLGEEFGVFVLELLRGDEKVWSPRAQILEEGDILIARGDWSKLDHLRVEAGLEINTEFQFRTQTLEEGTEQVLTEVLIAPRSRVIGSSLALLDRRWRHNATVLAIHRRGQILRKQLKDVRLDVGDVLLMLTPEAEMPALRNDPNVIVLSERGADKPAGWRAPFALATMALVIGISAIGWAPIAITSSPRQHAAAVWMRTRSMTPSLAHHHTVPGCCRWASPWPERAAEFIAANTSALGAVGRWSAGGALSVALLLTEFMSNAAAAVFHTHHVHRQCPRCGRHLLIAVTFAASTSFATPVGYQTNTMVYSAAATVSPISRWACR